MQKSKQYVIRISTTQNPRIAEYTQTNDPKDWSNRIRDNIRASKGEAAESLHFARWDKFKDVPYEDITIEIFVNTFGITDLF